MDENLEQTLKDFQEVFGTYSALSNGPPGSSLEYTALIRGYNLFPHFPKFWPIIKNFPVREDDIFIATFPKSGTTWLQLIVYLLMSEDFESIKTTPIDYSVPFLEMPRPITEETLNKLSNRPGPRIMKTHLPVCLLPSQVGKGRIVFCYRNAKDVVVSLYHHCQALSQCGLQLTFDEFARKFMEGKGINLKWRWLL